MKIHIAIAVILVGHAEISFAQKTSPLQDQLHQQLERMSSESVVTATTPSEESTAVFEYQADESGKATNIKVLESTFSEGEKKAEHSKLKKYLERLNVKNEDEKSATRHMTLGKFTGTMETNFIVSTAKDGQSSETSSQEMQLVTGLSDSRKHKLVIDKKTKTPWDNDGFAFRVPKGVVTIYGVLYTDGGIYACEVLDN